MRTYDDDGTVGSNGNRTSQSSNTFGPDCATTPGTPTSRSYGYDTADRPTTGNGGSGQHVYDALGRQSTMPAADAPTPGDGTAAHNITLAYYDSDLPQAITQDGTTTGYVVEYGLSEELPGISQRVKYDAEKNSIRTTGSRAPSYTVTTVVRPSAVARAALRGALDLIAQAGGGAVEGYPRDTRGEKMTASHLYNVSEAGL